MANASRLTSIAKCFPRTHDIEPTAIVGGSIVLRLQRDDAALAPFVCLSRWLVVLLGVASGLLIADAFRAWRGHRRRLTKVAGRDDRDKYIIPEPGFWPSVGFIGMMAVIIVAICLYLEI